MNDLEWQELRRLYLKCRQTAIELYIQFCARYGYDMTESDAKVILEVIM